MLSGAVCGLNSALFSFGFGNTVKSLLRQPRFLSTHSQFGCQARLSRGGENTIDIVSKYSHCNQRKNRERGAIKKMGLLHDAAPTFKSYGVPHDSIGMPFYYNYLQYSFFFS